ncbi:hypothetical protein R3P38DRAFT_3193769 [Favolaschia claudopus]|uniref:Uncharacterized protein n=1 Tax=Favolaschia claudopus TaxID=2862362 RepID=A0AAW0BGU8_9AGAR
MQHLWNHELDRNEMEAASHVGILARFYTYIRTLECKVTCDGVVVLVPLTQGPSKYGKHNFVGCSKWNRSEKGKHLYASIDANVDEGDLRFVMDNGGLLPERLVPANESAPCVLTVHPRITLGHCPYSHIIDGKIEIAKMVPRRCHSRLVIFIPVAPLPLTLSHKAIIFLEKSRTIILLIPRVKPSTEDRLKLDTAIQGVGVNGLTVQKLLNAPNTSTVYGGQPIAEASPAYADTQKVRKAISAQKKLEHPHGMDWDGVVYHLNMREPKLAPAERYIHTAMNKNGFKLVVTMHPQIAILIHRVRYLGIDYTFKRVDGEMDEWEVGGFVDRYNQRLTLASLYCDKQNTEAFAQLFKEFFDAIRHVTGEIFKLAPFYPDAKCRVVILDGEVPQVLGFGTFLADYNDPNISRIWTREPTKLVQYCLKVCSVHFERHIDELPDHIPQSTIKRLKSIMGLKTQAEIDEWHQDVDKFAENEITIKHWKEQKDRNSWMWGAINKFMSKIAPEDHDITPNHSNLVETAHAARNAETGIHLPLLEAILQAQERDNIKVRELAAIDRNGVMPKRWNGAGARERHAAQRRNWAARKIADRNDQLTSYDTLKKELETGAEENRQSLARQKEAEAEIKTLQEELVIDKRRSDFRERINALRKDVEEEKSERREWAVRRQQLNSELDRLRKEELAGVRINGRRPERPSATEAMESYNISTLIASDLAHSVGPTADSRGLLEYEPAELPIESSISTIEAFRFGESVDISDRPSTSMFGTGAEAHVFAASEDSSIFTFSPLGFDTDTNVSGNPSTSMFGNDTANLAANSVGLVAANNNYQVDPSANGFYSDENGFSSNFNAFDYDQFDRFMLNTNAFEPAGHIQPDNMWSYSRTREESLDPEPMKWTRASQELPHLPMPNFDPTPSPTPSQQQETNSDSPADLDDYVAPQDIDLELMELECQEWEWPSPTPILLTYTQQKSSVFADMFAFPQPASSDVETMDGVPVVTVHDNSAEMEDFLKAIFDSDFFMPPPAKATIVDCLGILRLAHKYDVPYLRRRSLLHLHSMFPSCLSDLFHKIDQNLTELIAMIATGTEVGALWLLPAAYYLILSQWPLSMIAQSNRQQASAATFAWSPQIHKIFSFLFVASNEDDEECQDWAECNKCRIHASSHILPPISQGNPGSVLRWFTEEAWGNVGLCEHCLREAQEMYKAATQTCWDELPKMFGLPEWEQLEQMRNAALAP